MRAELSILRKCLKIQNWMIRISENILWISITSVSTKYNISIFLTKWFIFILFHHKNMKIIPKSHKLNIRKRNVNIWISRIKTFTSTIFSFEILRYLPFKQKSPWKESKYGVFSDPYFPAFRLNTEIYGKSPYSVQIQENTDQKKLRIWTFFAQCYSWTSL